MIAITREQLEEVVEQLGYCPLVNRREDGRYEPTFVVRIEERFMPCQSLDEASEICRAFSSIHQLGPSELDGGEVYDRPPMTRPEPKPIAVVGNGGRIWKVGRSYGPSVAGTRRWWPCSMEFVDGLPHPRLPVQVPVD